MKNTVVGLLTMICAVASVGCHRSVTEDKHTHRHRHAGMIEHIAEGHGIHIGTNTSADIVITEVSNTVSVVFSPSLLKRMPPDCLPVLHFTRPEKVLTEEEFEGFLQDFHDYLLLTYGEGHGPGAGRDL